MSDVEDHGYDALLGDETGATPPGGRRRAKSRARGLRGCLVGLLALVVLLGGLYLAVTKGVGVIQDQFGEAEDYPGPGTGSVTFQVRSGDTATDIARSLKDEGVVASVDSFVNAANANPESGRIQAGYYELKQEMKASDALEVLVDPDNVVTTRITIPEGLRVEDVVSVLAKKTDFAKARFEKVLDSPGDLGLPEYADGNAEGYLFPATYSFGPDATPVEMLKAMVTRWRQAASDVDLEAAAKQRDYTPAELMTIASLIQAEGRGDDMPKISRVIYNRLENPDNGVTQGLLQIDATVNYALGRNLGVALSQEELDVDSPYNTRKNPGLPPGPIESPGDKALQAALEPADGSWLFYVTVNLKTGETKFATTIEEFNKYKAEYQKYCETSEAC